MALIMPSGSLARDLVNQIRQDLEAVAPAVRELWECWGELRGADGRAYTSWADMCAAEFAGIIFPAQERREVVATLVEAGMSNRAIAAAVGASEPTVRRDVEQLRRNDAVDVPEARTGQDGRTRRPPAKVEDDAGRHLRSVPPTDPPLATPRVLPKTKKKPADDDQVGLAVEVLELALVKLTDGQLDPQFAAQVLVSNLRDQPKVLDTLVAEINRHHSEAVAARRKPRGRRAVR